MIQKYNDFINLSWVFSFLGFLSFLEKYFFGGYWVFERETISVLCLPFTFPLGLLILSLQSHFSWVLRSAHKNFRQRLLQKENHRFFWWFLWAERCYFLLVVVSPQSQIQIEDTKIVVMIPLHTKHRGQNAPILKYSILTKYPLNIIPQRARIVRALAYWTFDVTNQRSARQNKTG